MDRIQGGAAARTTFTSEEPQSSEPPAPVCAARSEHVVDHFNASGAMAERAVAAREFSFGEQAVLDQVLTLGRDDFGVVNVRGFVKGEGAGTEADARCIVRHEPDDTWIVELAGKGYVGPSEAGSGAEAAVGADGAIRLRFQSPEGVADFLQAVATSPLPFGDGKERAALGFHENLESMRLGALAKVEVGSHQHGIGKELAMLGKLGAEVSGGVSVTVDRANGELVLEGKVEGLVVAQVHAPWAQLANAGAQVKTEVKFEHHVKVDERALEDLLSGRRTLADFALEGEMVLKLETQVDCHAVAGVAGAGKLVRTETEIELGALHELSREGFSAALAQAEVRAQAFTSLETDIGGLGVDARALGGGFGWRRYRETADVQTTLGELAAAAHDALFSGDRPVSTLDAQAAAARLRQ